MRCFHGNFAIQEKCVRMNFHCFHVRTCWEIWRKILKSLLWILKNCSTSWLAITLIYAFILSNEQFNFWSCCVIAIFTIIYCNYYFNLFCSLDFDDEEEDEIMPVPKKRAALNKVQESTTKNDNKSNKKANESNAKSKAAPKAEQEAPAKPKTTRGRRK